MGEEKDQFVWIDITISKPSTAGASHPPLFNIARDTSAELSVVEFEKIETLISTTLDEISIDNLPSIFQVHRVLNEIEISLESLYLVCP